ncbi:MAG: hypothetical protein ACT4OK_15860 [Gemmobacter sp.]
MNRLLIAIWVLAGAVLIPFDTAAETAVKVNLGWETSCGADKGSIRKTGTDYVFRTSRNHCQGGIFNQRAEIGSRDIAVSKAVTYVFQSRIAMRAAADRDFIVFQIHDGRNGCAPPMSLRWTSANRLRFDSAFTRGIGEDGCVENAGLRNARYAGPALRRDGTSYDLAVRLSFDGQGNFNVAVSINGEGVLSGRYEPSTDPRFIRSRRFYMKHGVYSPEVFDYELLSQGMRVLRVSD